MKLNLVCVFVLTMTSSFSFAQNKQDPIDFPARWGDHVGFSRTPKIDQDGNRICTRAGDVKTSEATIVKGNGEEVQVTYERSALVYQLLEWNSAGKTHSECQLVERRAQEAPKACSNSQLENEYCDGSSVRWFRLVVAGSGPVSGPLEIGRTLLQWTQRNAKSCNGDPRDQMAFDSKAKGYQNRICFDNNGTNPETQRIMYEHREAKMVDPKEEEEEDRCPWRSETQVDETDNVPHEKMISGSHCF